MSDEQFWRSFGISVFRVAMALIIKVSLANSIKLTLAYPIQSLTLSLLFGLPLLMGLINSELLILAIYSSSFIGLSVIQELRSRIMLRIFATIQRKQERENCEKTIY